MSDAEDALAFGMKALQITTPEREHMFMPGRRWRFDFAWPRWKVAVEVEGGLFVGGRHTRGRQYEKDCEKYNEAAINGWLVIRVTPDMVNDGRAYTVISRALGIRGLDARKEEMKP